ncbi:MAG: CTP synthase [Patescibacteria group bacterium]
MARATKEKKKRGFLLPRRRHKYIFVIGGVMSGVGKGITTSSIGTLLEARGIHVNIVKVDPYLNVDAGTMNPTEHGEVFVLKSGLECDQDLGNYERFLNRDLNPEDSITSGMVYQYVLRKERSLGYGGKCVEAIPHVQDEIIRRFTAAAAANHSDVSVIEIGGTVGDFQNALFIEAARVMHMHAPDDVLFIMVSYLPVPDKLGEMKTKPTQNAVRALNAYGVQPNVIIARSDKPLDEKRKEKIALFCNVAPEAVISAPDVESIYDVPLNFAKDGLDALLLKLLTFTGKPLSRPGLTAWKEFVRKSKETRRTVDIAIVGKYFDTGDFILSDAYLSVIEAIKFSSYAQGLKPKIHWLNAKDFEKDRVPLASLDQYDGIIVPGGFGETGIEGKIKVIGYAREHTIPYFGLCYGMQLMLVEFARNVLSLPHAHTTEISPGTPNPVIDVMPDQVKKIANARMGGTMRLGHYAANLKKGTIAQKAYGANSVDERHRHRYEVNPKYTKRFEEAGVVFSGVSPDGILMEIAELPESAHPFMLGTQFHPELQARPLRPHPLFTAFIRAAANRDAAKR